MWNYSPYDVMDAQSLHELRKEVDRFMEEKMTQNENVQRHHLGCAAYPRRDLEEVLFWTCCARALPYQVLSAAATGFLQS